MEGNRAVVRGTDAVVKWGYHVAATLGSWTLSADSRGGTVTASVVTHDACAVSQQPLAFVVPRPKGQRWIWPVQTLQIVDGQLQASVGPLQE